MPVEPAPLRVPTEFLVLEGWGRRPRSAAWLATPDRTDQLTGLVRDGTPPRGLLARGLGRSYNDAALNAGGLVVCTTALRGVGPIDPASGTVAVGAGVSIAEVIRTVLPQGWFPPVVPGTAHVTIGGAIAADVHGKNHHHDGSFCQWVRDIVLQAPSDEPRRITPESDPDAFWATAGGMGLTGLIHQATLQLIPVQTSWMRVHTIRTATFDDTLSAMEESDTRHRYAVAWIDLTPQGSRSGRGVLTNADHASYADLGAADYEHGVLGHDASKVVALPDLVPGGLLRPTGIRLLNSSWYRLSRAGTSLQPFQRYFFPLDRLAHWNRLYGRRGFLQYQIAVPEPETLRQVIKELRIRRLPINLAVLKRFRGASRYISFPMSGWTLALDIPIDGAALPSTLERCDELVAAAGGRVYLAKDSRVRPEVFQTMYPQISRWQAVRSRLDPQESLRSDLGRRLGLLEGSL